MWLEYKHQTFVWIFFRGGQRSADLCRMMCIIINDRDAIYASFILENVCLHRRKQKGLQEYLLLKSLSQGQAQWQRVHSKHCAVRVHSGRHP